MVAVLLLAGFFATIFEVNAVCLRYIDATKETMAAFETIQDRGETLRSLSFTDLTNSTYVSNLLSTTANASDFAKNVTETITINDYNTGTDTATFVRSAGATVTPTASSSGATPGSSGVVVVNVKVDWAMTLGRRSRTESTSFIVADGTKK